MILREVGYIFVLADLFSLRQLLTVAQALISSPQTDSPLNLPLSQV